MADNIADILINIISNDIANNIANNLNNNLTNEIARHNQSQHIRINDFWPRPQKSTKLILGPSI